MWLHKTHSLIFLIVVFSREGGIADNVAKWVFRQNLAPQRLKEILQETEDKDKDVELGQTSGEEGNDEKEQRPEDTDRTAGQD